MKLHLGCGKRYLSGYIHIDMAEFDHIDYKTTIDQLPMFEDDSVELLYCCHALEYFDRDQVNTVLKEWHRVLKPSGILRLAVPDFEAICNVYLKYKDLDHKGILGPLYGKWSQNDDVIYHRTVYDFTSLEQVLTSNGFNNIMKFDADLVFDADYDDCSKAYVPHLDKTGILISLNVEATK